MLAAAATTPTQEGVTQKWNIFPPSQFVLAIRAMRTWKNYRLFAVAVNTNIIKAAEQQSEKGGDF